MEEKTDKIYYIPVDDILPNRFQPRLAFDEKELNNLADSILKYGVIQPIVLRKISDKYEIIAGERRYKAACLAGLKSIPAVINNTDDNTSAEIALLENLQRKNLTVIEEAQSYKKLIDRGFTQEDIANKLGVSQSSIANKIRLLNLPKEVRDALLYNQISERHARCLLTLNDENLQKEVLNKIIDDKLTVRQTEEEISKILMRNTYSGQSSSETYQLDQIIETQPIKENTKSDNSIDEFLDFKVPPVVNINNSNNNDYIKENDNDKKYNDNNIKSNDDNGEISFTEIVSSDDQINPFISNNNSNRTSASYSSFVSNREMFEKESETIINKTDSNSNLQKIVDNIKNYVKNIDSNDSIRTTEIDLNNKYQIIIEIDKNAN